MPLFAIYNPACGNRSAKHFFEEQVMPYLESRGKSVAKALATEYEGHAGSALSSLLETVDEKGVTVTLILCSGDGTLHEIINTVSSTAHINLVIVPCGTANALYSSLFPRAPSSSGSADILLETSYRLQSLQAFIEGRRAVPLSFALTDITGSTSSPLTSSVVTSTCLHAAILSDSESLRASLPGIERFKVAAHKNSSTWYRGRVRLMPIPSENSVQIYDPISETFVQTAGANAIDILEIPGPFAYFLATVNVDRLEPSFSVTPLSRTHPPPPGTCDVVILRPLRDPTVSDDDPDTRSSFVPKLWSTLNSVYQNGSHIKLRYDDQGNIVTVGDGFTVVEYVRCGGWQWIPDINDDGSHLLCSDGTIIHIERGGRADCKISAFTAKNTRFAVYS